MQGKSLTMFAVGDVTLERPQGEFYLSKVAEVLRSGDVVVGNGEIVFSTRGTNPFGEVFSQSYCPPENLKALAAAGFNVITLATNHIYDRGALAIEDTITGLRNNGIAVVGAGMNIYEAKTPVILLREGTKFGFLNYNCVGPKGQWSTVSKPGCAYINIISHYEANNNPGGPPDVYTFGDRGSLRMMSDDIRNLRSLCDILVVIFHKGIRLTPKLAMYDQEVSYAAIDAGADLVLGHHSYLKGIEQYKGKTIFHSLGLFVPARSEQKDEQNRMYMPVSDRNVSEVYAVPSYPLHYPYRQLTMIAKCMINNGKIQQVSFIPCLVNEQKQPEMLKNDEKGQLAFDFMELITREAGLNTGFAWKGDEIVIQSPDESAN